MGVGTATPLGDPPAGSGEWGECLVPLGEVPAGLAAEVRRELGAIPDWVARIAASPWVVRTLCALMNKPMAYAPRELADLISLVVSQDNSCRYCYGTQRAIMRILGYRKEYIERLVRDFHTAELSRAEQAALEFSRKLSRAHPRPGRAELEELRGAGFGAPAANEIAVSAAGSAFTNRLATFLALPPEGLESMVERPLFRLLRPLVAWRMRDKRRRPEPPPPNEGLLARLVAALGDSPSAGVMRRTIDAAYGPGALPRRTKLLALAVVARAVGCPYTEHEAAGALAAEGMARADLEEVLTTLGSSRLDAREARIVPFARETVRYQPAAIQRRVREVVRDFTAEETLELLGVVAFANAVSRLSVVLDAS